MVVVDFVIVMVFGLVIVVIVVVIEIVIYHIDVFGPFTPSGQCAQPP